MDALEGLLLAPTAASAGVYLTMVGGFLAGLGRRTTFPKPRQKPRVTI
jgi:hypothetical protein